MKKIVIITDTFFTKRDLIRFGFNDIGKKFNLLFISSVKIFNKSFFQINKNNYKNKITQKYIKSIEELNSFFQHNKDIKLIIDFMSITQKNLSIRKIFEIHQIKVLRYANGAIPEKIYFRSTMRDIKKLNFFNIIKKIFNYIKFQSIKKKNFNFFDYILVGSLADDKKFSGKKIYAHSTDYETYLESKKKIKKNKKFAIFLDEMLPNAPDYNLFNINEPVDYHQYWSEISKTLKKLEKKLKLKIIICLHPKNTKKNKYIKSFIVKIGSTSDLVQDCSLVIMHSTTAINYAIINKKPILFLNSKNYVWLTDRINFFQKQINGAILFLEKNFNIEINDLDAFSLDKKKYKLYLENYIKHPLSKNERLGEIVAKLALNL